MCQEPKLHFSQVIFHTHSDFATSLACLSGSHFPTIHQNGVRFHNRYAFQEDYGLPNVHEEAELLGHALGDKDILFMCNHGTSHLAKLCTQWKVFS